MTDHQRERQHDQLLRLYGLHAVTAVLDHRPADLLGVSLAETATSERLNKLVERCRELGVRVEFERRRRLDQLVNGAVHQGIVAQVRAPRRLGESDLERLLVADARMLFLVLEAVQDPQNLGACLRAADGAGVAAVVIPARGGVGLTPVVWKASSGAVERVRLVQVNNLNKALGVMASAGVRLVGLSGEATTSVYEADLGGSMALVLGSEGRGLRPRTLGQCNQQVSIPMRGYCTSLNLSVAAGICLYEVLRQYSA